MTLTEKELIEITGGAASLKAAILVGLGGLITLIIGIIDGYINPDKCNMRKK